MAKKYKSEVKKTYNKYRNAKVGFKVGKYTAIAAPYAVECGINFDEWFVYNENAWQTSLGFSLAVGVLGIGMWLNAKKDTKDQLLDSSVTMIVGWFAVACIFYLLSSIIAQIAMIMFYGGLGMIVSIGLGQGEKVYAEKAQFYREEMIKHGIGDKFAQDKENARILAEKEARRRSAE